MSSETPLHIEIYRVLKAQIINNELVPGTQLPTEYELADSFHVSRITAHKALQRLAQERLITRHRGKGSFVAKSNTVSIVEVSPENVDVSAPGLRLIGFVLPDVYPWYGLDLLRSVVIAAGAAHISVITSFTGHSLDNEEVAIRRILNAGVGGLLIYPLNGEYHNQEILRLSLRRFPLVLVDRNLAKIPLPFVSSDNRSAAFELTTHLLNLGHRRIGYLTPEIRGTVTLEERYSGYVSALSAMGLAPYDNQGNYMSLPAGAGLGDADKYSTAMAAVTAYLKEHLDMTAIITTEYGYAMMLFDICASSGIAVPDELSIVCFDSAKSDAYSFTHIQQDEAAIAHTAIDTLVSLMAQKQSESATDISTTVPAKLVVGNTSAPPRSAPLLL